MSWWVMAAIGAASAFVLLLVVALVLIYQLEDDFFE
jgi:hypothetical protein